MSNDFVVLIHALAYLAVHRDQQFSSQDLAYNACSNPALVRKVMKLAVEAGYVAAQQGVGGGYRFIGQAEDVKLGQLYRLLKEDERERRNYKDSIQEECLVANNMASVLMDLEEERIALQLAYYDGKSLADIISSLSIKDAERKAELEG